MFAGAATHLSIGVEHSYGLYLLRPYRLRIPPLRSRLF